MTLDKAYKTSGKIFEQVTKRTSPALAEQLARIEAGEIVVVHGVHDHVETLLDTIKIPYHMISPGEVDTYNGGRVLFVNCRGYNESGVPVEAVQEFVSGGGRLVTTDWALAFAAKCFPNRLFRTATTGDDVVEIQAPTDLARRFLGLNYAQCHPKWWLEGSSHVYKIGQGVTELITSAEMKAKYGQPYIAVGFPEGAGEVFHFISHLELQRTHLRTKADAGTLDEFLAKMQVGRSDEMEDASIAELEAAYSTLNTVAQLCSRLPLLGGSGNSQLFSPSTGAKSTRLA